MTRLYVFLNRALCQNMNIVANPPSVQSIHGRETISGQREWKWPSGGGVESQNFRILRFFTIFTRKFHQSSPNFTIFRIFTTHKNFWPAWGRRVNVCKNLNDFKFLRLYISVLSKIYFDHQGTKVTRKFDTNRQRRWRIWWYSIWGWYIAE